MKLHPMCGHEGCVWCQGVVERARADERAAIVAYLRGRAGYGPVADAIERAEHMLSPAGGAR